jgi:hypothetical protein
MDSRNRAKTRIRRRLAKLGLRLRHNFSYRQAIRDYYGSYRQSVRATHCEQDGAKSAGPARSWPILVEKESSMKGRMAEASSLMLPAAMSNGGDDGDSNPAASAVTALRD